MAVQLIVNGQAADVVSPPDTPLLWVLRDEFGCSGAKFGCGLEQCGACSVLVDGAPRASCQLPIGDLDGRSVATIEALATQPDGRRVVDALLARNAGQCGYCLPGIAVTLTSLVARGRSLTRTEIVNELDAHLCRCGSQPGIIAAALELVGEAS